MLDKRDGQPGSEAVVVNRRFVERFLGGGSALGRRIMLRDGEKVAPWATIVGVIPHVRHNDLTRDDLDAVVYRSLEASSTRNYMIALRSQQPPTTLAGALRESVREMDQDLPVFQVNTMADIMARQRWPFRVFGTLFVLFAVFGLVLSTIGMYAVTAYAVGQRRTEIGLRMALGAQQSHVAWIVLRRGVVQLSVGLPLGVALAYSVMVGMKTLLVGLKPGDPITLASIVGIVIAVTLTACLLPAARAARLNPVAALRN